ncbi:MAG: DUF4177 domain-containing protein [bacterium]
MDNLTQWEYKVLTISAQKGFWGGKVDIHELNSRLSELGEQKWELVSTSVTHMGYGWSRDLVAIFKRAKR